MTLAMNRLALAASSRIFALLSAAVLAAGCASADAPITADETTSTSADPVELADFWAQVAVANDGSIASKATGSLEIPFLDASGHQRVSSSNPARPLRGTCGVTFISPHYAITASHCVSDRNLPSTSGNILVHTYDVTQANVGTLEVNGNLTGFYPSYSGTPPTAVPGYVRNDFQCHLTARCAWNDSDPNANATSFNCAQTGSVDVTLINCPTRASNAAWLPVSSTDIPNAQVEVYWFHEIVNAPVTQPPAGDYADLDLWNHYTVFSSQETEWHYIDSPLNALVPLKSIPFYGGVPRTRMGTSNYVNAFGCHGTSGSGVLQHNGSSLELLGPAHSGNWASNRLCDSTSLSPTSITPTSIVSGAGGFTFSSADATRQLAAQFAQTIFRDRPLVIHPIGPIGPIGTLEP